MVGISDRQQTVASRADLSGIGLHTGVKVNLRLSPAPANEGIVFRRTDLDGFSIEALAKNVARVSYATSLMKKGVLISTTEHLLSALAASQVDNAYVDLDNLELPIMDGSALPFLELVRRAGVRRQRAGRARVRILKPVEAVDGAKRIAVFPSESFQVTYRISFPHPLIGNQELVYSSADSNYENDIAPARTFGFMEEVETLRASGLIRGGSLENAVVLTRDGLVNSGGLRYPDEFCRHKILDLIGDLSLLGYPLIGHIVADRAGHAMHLALITRLLRDKSAWELVTAERASRPKPSPIAVDHEPVALGKPAAPAN